MSENYKLTIMKELSIEEKAQAYDEALEKARQLCAYPTTKPFINDLQDIFPELKESEDERIKKTLINFFSKGAEYDSSTNGIKDRNIIAWLEKQKPADKDEPKFKVKYAGSEYNVFETKEIAGVTFYGIEDEPNHIDYVKADNCEIISVYAIKENGSPYPTKPAVFSEKKPKRMISAEAKEAMYDKSAWSEEDEEHYKACLQYFDAVNPDMVYYKDYQWLKSLKQKIGG